MADRAFAKLQALPKDAKPVTTWNNSDEAFLDIARGIRRAAQELTTSPGSGASRGDDEIYFPRVWNVPYHRNPNFTGRENILAQLDNALNSGEPAALVQAITGLGGIGKTQIALEYAYRHLADYDVVWWLRAEQADTLAADYAALAMALDLPGKDQPDQDAIIAVVRNWLQRNTGWLLIFDNAVAPQDLRGYLPQGTAKRVLITSRESDWSSLARSVDVPVWPRDESVKFLLDRTSQSDVQAADQLAEVLGDLPLAMEQAGAYMKSVSLSLEAYRKLFITRRQDLWQEERPPESYHEDTVATTWSLAMEEVAKAAPIGADILNFCAFLAPDKIPRTLIPEIAGYLSEELAGLLSDELILNGGIKALKHFSLIESDENSISVHRLVQLVVRDRLSSEAQLMWARAALKLISTAFPSEGFDNVNCWPKCSALLVHAETILRHTEEDQSVWKAASLLLNNVGEYLTGRGQYRDSLQPLQRALALRKAVLGDTHLDVAYSMNNVGVAFDNLGRFGDAKLLYINALEIRETQLGAEHPDVATSLNNLALLLHAKGEHSEAEPLFRRALEIRETHLGREHPSVATSLNNLALLLDAQGKYSEAEFLYRRALEIYIAQLGAENPYVAGSLNNLAGLLYDRGNHNEAESLFRRALEIRERQLGAEHPAVANSLNGLALLLHNQGYLEEAEPLYRRALEILEVQLGVEHPSVATCLNNLALLLHDQHNYGEAESLYRRALEIYEAQLGSEHPSVADSLSNLASLLQVRGRIREARALSQRVKQIRKAHKTSVKSTLQQATPKTGRNDPCPCGSGKKYKKCCGK